jgi:hypothetical protein
MFDSGAGEGVSKLMTGGELTGSLDITASSSSSSSELSRVRSMTGPFAGLGADEDGPAELELAAGAEFIIGVTVGGELLIDIVE